MLRPVIFLDDGGVMNDNEVRGPQWQRLVSEFFAPRLGGKPELWTEANRVVATRLFEFDQWQARLLAATNYESFDRAYQLDWLAGMCTYVGVAMPDEDESLALAYSASTYITARVRSAFPGAVDAIRTLHSQGYTLHTASGESSRELNGYLTGMGVRECFGRLYGPDLIDTFKNGPAYHERIFADMGIDPADALIVDDGPQVIAWAIQAGAHAILVDPHSYISQNERSNYIKSLAALPEMLECMLL